MPKKKPRNPTTSSANGVVGYARVSTVGQAVEGVSLDDQVNAIRRWSVERGFKVLRIYREEGKSGRTTEGRAAFREALEYCAANATKVGALVVYDLSRFARDAGDQIRVREQLSRVGIRLTSVALDIYNDAHGGLVSGILGTTSEFVSRLSGEKISRCMAEVARRGGWPWRAPLGYRNGRDQAGGKIVEPDPLKGELIRIGFELVAEGFGPTEALRRITAMGLRSVFGRTLFPKEFRAILQHPFYRGRVTSIAFGVDVAGKHPALVSPDLWQRVQERLKTRNPPDKPAPSGAEVENLYPLRGIIVCEACGRPLTASASRGKSGAHYPYYHCWRDCAAAVRLAARRLDQDFGKQLTSLQIDPNLWAVVEAHLLEIAGQINASSTEHETLFRRRRQELQKKRERLVETYLAEEIDQLTYRRLLKRSDADLQTVDFEHRKHQSETFDLSELLTFAKTVATDLYGLWNRLDRFGRQRLARLVFPAGVLVSREGLRTPETDFIFSNLRRGSCDQAKMVEQKGFEPSTPTLRTWCSPS